MEHKLTIHAEAIKGHASSSPEYGRDNRLVYGWRSVCLTFCFEPSLDQMAKEGPNCCESLPRGAPSLSEDTLRGGDSPAAVALCP